MDIFRPPTPPEFVRIALKSGGWRFCTPFFSYRKMDGTAVFVVHIPASWEPIVPFEARVGVFHCKSELRVRIVEDAWNEASGR